MESWLRALLSFLLISDTYVRTNSEETKDTKVNPVRNKCCDPKQYQQLQDRLETLEAAVRNIVSAIASQKKGHFAPINAILERDPVLQTVFSSHDNAGVSISKDDTVLFGKLTCYVKREKHEWFFIPWAMLNFCISLPQGEAEQSEQERSATNQMQRALKCSLAHLLDINTPGTI